MTNFNFNYLLSGFTAPSFGQIVMLLLSGMLMYQAIFYKQRPLLLMPMAVAMLAVNMPLPNVTANVIDGVLGFMFRGAITGIYPVLIFFTVGTMIDLGLLLADPKNFFIGASAQIGMLLVFFIMASFSRFTGIDLQTTAATAIIGSADGAMAMYLGALMSPSKFAAIAVAAYFYMGLLPVLQPKIMSLLTTKKERRISMDYLRHVSRGEKIIFAIIAIATCGILLANAFPLIAALMFGNILRESGIMKSFSISIQKSLTNILTMLIGIAVGTSATPYTFLTLDTLLIFLFGFLAFIFSTSFGIITAKIINLLSGGKTNPIIGSAGISAFPIPAWSAHLFAQEASSSNCLLLHAMAVNTAGIMSGAIAAGILLTLLH